MGALHYNGVCNDARNQRDYVDGALSQDHFNFTLLGIAKRHCSSRELQKAQISAGMNHHAKTFCEKPKRRIINRNYAILVANRFI